jgi:hypothetical protein
MRLEAERGGHCSLVDVVLLHQNLKEALAKMELTEDKTKNPECWAGGVFLAL